LARRRLFKEVAGGRTRLLRSQPDRLAYNIRKLTPPAFVAGPLSCHSARQPFDFVHVAILSNDFI